MTNARRVASHSSAESSELRAYRPAFVFHRPGNCRYACTSALSRNCCIRTAISNGYLAGRQPAGEQSRAVMIQSPDATRGVTTRADVRLYAELIARAPLSQGLFNRTSGRWANSKVPLKIRRRYAKLAGIDQGRTRGAGDREAASYGTRDRLEKEIIPPLDSQARNLGRRAIARLAPALFARFGRCKFLIACAPGARLARFAIKECAAVPLFQD